MNDRIIGGLFTDPARGETALEELQRTGFSSAQISEVADDHEAPAAQPLANPETDFFKDHTASGTTFRDTLGELGMSQADASHFEEGVARGGALVTVKAGSRSADAIDVLRRHGADLGSQGVGDATTGMAKTGMAATAAGAATNQARGDVADERTLELKSERLAIDKVRVASGSASIRKRVVSEQQSIDVPVAHEELVIERRPVTGGAVGGTIGQDETVTVPLSREEVRVDKRTVVTEEVEIGKRAVAGTENVSETIRHEELVVDPADQTRPPSR